METPLTLAAVKTAIATAFAASASSALVTWENEPRKFDKPSGVRVILSWLASVNISLTDRERITYNTRSQLLDVEQIEFKRATVRCRVESLSPSDSIGAGDTLESIRAAMRGDRSVRALLGTDVAFLDASASQDLSIPVDGRDVSRAAADFDFHVRIVRDRASLDWIETVTVTRKSDFGPAFGVSYG